MRGRDYQLLTKGSNSLRAKKVVRQTAREVWQTVRPQRRWVAVGPNKGRYARRTQTLALRWLTETGNGDSHLKPANLLKPTPSPPPSASP